MTSITEQPETVPETKATKKGRWWRTSRQRRARQGQGGEEGHPGEEKRPGGRAKAKVAKPERKAAAPRAESIRRKYWR